MMVLNIKSLINMILLITCVTTKCLPNQHKEQEYSPNVARKASIKPLTRDQVQTTNKVTPSRNTEQLIPAFEERVIFQRPPPQTVGPSIPPGTSQWGLECLEEHNLRRASSETLDRKSLVPLVWDQSLSQSAKSWADQLAYQNNGLTHSKLGNGENLYSTTDRGSSCKAAVDAWFNEYPLYYNQKIGGAGFKGYGHFTQLVWPETTKIGCAFSDNASNRYVVCHYDPA